MASAIAVHATKSDQIKLHLGCGHQRIADWVNCDLMAPADKNFDVQVAPWPFDDNAAAVIYASHLLEHLRDPWTFMREAWRVLAPGASMTLRLPYGDHRAAWYDLTHIRPWYAENFCCFQPGYAQAVGNPQTEGWEYPFGVTSVDLRVSGKFAPLMRRRWLRCFMLPYLDCIANCIEEMWVYMVALKSPDAVAEWRQRQPHANAVGTRLVMYEHHLQGRLNPKAGEPVRLIGFNEEQAVNGLHA